MAIDLMKLALESFKPQQEAAPDAATIEAATARIVKRMSSAGYRFDAATIEAARAYAEGYALLLTGNVGTGKTYFFKKLNPEIYTLDMNFATRWKFAEIESWLDNHWDDEVVIDDLGVGSAKGNDYGAQYDVLMCLLNGRIRSSKRTHFTTNCNADQLIAAYDYRAYDRILGMAKPFKMARTESLRNPARFVF